MKSKLSALRVWLDKRQAKALLTRLREIDKDEWLAIGHCLNTWRFPFQFYDLVPKWWEGNKRVANKKLRVDRALDLLRPVMNEIDKAFSKKEQSRYHNVGKGDMADAEFEYWWENCSMRSPNKKNEEMVDKYYDRKMFMKDIRWWEDDIFNAIKESLKVKSKST